MVSVTGLDLEALARSVREAGFGVPLIRGHPLGSGDAFVPVYSTNNSPT